MCFRANSRFNYFNIRTWELISGSIQYQENVIERASFCRKLCNRRVLRFNPSFSRHNKTKSKIKFTIARCLQEYFDRTVTKWLLAANELIFSLFSCRKTKTMKTIWNTNVVNSVRTAISTTNSTNFTKKKCVYLNVLLNVNPSWAIEGQTVAGVFCFHNDEKYFIASLKKTSWIFEVCDREFDVTVRTGIWRTTTTRYESYRRYVYGQTSTTVRIPVTSVTSCMRTICT